MKTTNVEINNAIREVEVAKNNLDMAESAFVESAIFRYSAAMARLNALIQIAKHQKM
jgi:hypothetical protein